MPRFDVISFCFKMSDDNVVGIFLAASTLLYIIGYNLGQQKVQEQQVADMSLKGLHVVVTGANTGIGLKTSRNNDQHQ